MQVFRPHKSKFVRKYNFFSFFSKKIESIKKPQQINVTVLNKMGGDILFQLTLVSSAQSGLTSLFGMGRGDPRRNSHP